MTKDELIEKRKNDREFWADHMEEYNIYWKCIKDLTSLQEPTERVEYIKQPEFCECKDPIIMPFSKIKQCSKCGWEVSLD